MSLSLAAAWVSSAICHPKARNDALNLLQQAYAQGVEATLLIGPDLNDVGACYVGRWDGRELFVRELNEEQQEDWSVNSNTLLLQLEPHTSDDEADSADQLVSLSVEHIESADIHDGHAPLTGACVAEFQTNRRPTIRECALRAIYFRPDLSDTVTSWSYCKRDLLISPLKFAFQFSPLFGEMVPATSRGPLLVFLQLFDADNWLIRSGVRRISNVADVMVILR